MKGEYRLVEKSQKIHPRKKLIFTRYSDYFVELFKFGISVFGVFLYFYMN